MGLSTTHLIILLVIVVLIFGTKKLKDIGTDLGQAVKGFKDGMRDGEKPAEPPAQITATTHQDSTTIDVETRSKS